MSDVERPSGEEPVALPARPPGPPDPNFVAVSITSPAAQAQLPVGLPFTVTGHASSEQGTVTGVQLTLDGTAVQTSAVAGDRTSWQATVTLPSAGTHTLTAGAQDSLHASNSTTVRVNGVIDQPVLSCVSPAPTAPSRITTTTPSFNLAIHVQTLGSSVRATEHQLAAVGSQQWTELNAPGGANPNWSGTVTLPSTAVARNGTSYTLRVCATTAQGVASAIDLSVLALDATNPQIIAFTPADGAVLAAGTTPTTVTIQLTDAPPGALESGIATVTVQLDAQPPAPASATALPSTWTATLPLITHANHTITVVATDAQGNVSTAAHTAAVALTSWTRLVPVPRDPTLIEGLQARIADPLWLLARQAAFGEFAGQDAGSPVAVRLRARASSITRLRAAHATGSGSLLPPDSGPLETLSESEPLADGDPGALFVAQAGLHYLRLLQAAAGVGDLTGYRQGLLSAYPFPAPAPPQPGARPPAQATDPPLIPYAGRVPDSVRLYTDLSAALRPPGPGTLPATPALDAASASVVASVAHAWLTWYDGVAGQAGGAGETWTPDRLEYAFDVAAPGPDDETILNMAELSSETLGWFDFDLIASSQRPASGDTRLGAVASDLPAGEQSILFVGLPTPVTFRGMPNRRWWDFEDAAIDFGAITAPAESVTASLIIEFALRYGNDHFLIPVPLDIGSVCRTDSLVVLDTFGEALRIRPISDQTQTSMAQRDSSGSSSTN